MVGMSMNEQVGVAFSQKKLSEKRFERLKKDGRVKDRGFYDETEFQKIKHLRRDTEETNDRFKEIITFLENV